jgi:hypothetical protein
VIVTTNGYRHTLVLGFYRLAQRSLYIGLLPSLGLNPDMAHFHIRTLASTTGLT